MWNLRELAAGGGKSSQARFYAAPTIRDKLVFNALVPMVASARQRGLLFPQAANSPLIKDIYEVHQITDSQIDMTKVRIEKLEQLHKYCPELQKAAFEAAVSSGSYATREGMAMHIVTRATVVKDPVVYETDGYKFYAEVEQTEQGVVIVKSYIPVEWLLEKGVEAEGVALMLVEASGSLPTTWTSPTFDDLPDSFASKLKNKLASQYVDKIFSKEFKNIEAAEFFGEGATYASQAGLEYVSAVNNAMDSLPDRLRRQRDTRTILRTPDTTLFKWIDRDNNVRSGGLDLVLSILAPSGLVWLDSLGSLLRALPGSAARQGVSGALINAQFVANGNETVALIASRDAVELDHATSQDGGEDKQRLSGQLTLVDSDFGLPSALLVTHRDYSRSDASALREDSYLLYETDAKQVITARRLNYHKLSSSGFPTLTEIRYETSYPWIMED